MRLRHTTLAIFSCVTLATAAVGCDTPAPIEDTTMVAGPSAEAVSAPDQKEVLASLATQLETERVALLRYEGLRDGHALLSSVLVDGPEGVIEVFNVPVDLIDAPVLDVLETEGEVLATVTPSPKAGDLRLADAEHDVVAASPREASERLLADTAPTI